MWVRSDVDNTVGAKVASVTAEMPTDYSSFRYRKVSAPVLRTYPEAWRNNITYIMISYYK